MENGQRRLLAKGVSHVLKTVTGASPTSKRTRVQGSICADGKKKNSPIAADVVWRVPAMELLESGLS